MGKTVNEIMDKLKKPYDFVRGYFDRTLSIVESPAKKEESNSLHLLNEILQSVVDETPPMNAERIVMYVENEFDLIAWRNEYQKGPSFNRDFNGRLLELHPTMYQYDACSHPHRAMKYLWEQGSSHQRKLIQIAYRTRNRRQRAKLMNRLSAEFIHARDTGNIII